MRDSYLRVMEDLFDILVGIFSGNATYFKSILVIVAGVLIMVFSPLGLVTFIFGGLVILLGIVFLILNIVSDSNKKGK